MNYNYDRKGENLAKCSAVFGGISFMFFIFAFNEVLEKYSAILTVLCCLFSIAAVVFAFIGKRRTKPGTEPRKCANIGATIGFFVIFLFSWAGFGTLWEMLHIPGSVLTGLIDSGMIVSYFVIAYVNDRFL